MTFYNVISGILFLGACQAFLAALGTPAMFSAATLAVIILNESVITSELIERTNDPEDYRLGMKLLDFATFAALAWALLILRPSENAFGVDVAESLWLVGRPGYFWLLLAVYWVLTLIWNVLAKQLGRTPETRRWKDWFLVWAAFMSVPFFIMSAVTWRAMDFWDQPWWLGLIPLLIVSAYLLSKLFAGVRREPANREDVRRISAIINDRVTSVTARNIDALVAKYADDVLMFDVLQPLRYSGNADVRKRATEWLSSYAGTVGYEVRGLAVTAGADVAFCPYLYKVNGKRPDGTDVAMWVRATVCLRKIDGCWRIAHEHQSVPFDAKTGQALLTLTPDSA